MSTSSVTSPVTRESCAYVREEGSMITNHIINWSLAATLAALLCTAYLLDGPDDHSTERAQADSLSDALKTEAARIKRTQTIRDGCGANAGWVELGGGPARCTLKNGKPTARVVMVAP